MSNSSIWLIDRTLSSTTSPNQSWPGNDGNEGEFCIPQSTSTTEASQLDNLMSYPEHSWVGGVLFLCRDAVGGWDPAVLARMVRKGQWNPCYEHDKITLFSFIWFSLFFSGISTRYGLSKAEFFLCNHNYIFNVPLYFCSTFSFINSFVCTVLCYLVFLSKKKYLPANILFQGNNNNDNKRRINTSTLLVGDCSRGRQEASLFNSYYTEM